MFCDLTKQWNILFDNQISDVWPKMFYGLARPLVFVYDWISKDTKKLSINSLTKAMFLQYIRPKVNVANCFVCFVTSLYWTEIVLRPCIQAVSTNELVNCRWISFTVHEYFNVFFSKNANFSRLLCHNMYKLLGWLVFRCQIVLLNSTCYRSCHRFVLLSHRVRFQLVGWLFYFLKLEKIDNI